MPLSLTEINQISDKNLPGLFGIKFTKAERGLVEAELPVRPEIMAPNGFLHAGSVISLADSCAGWGSMLSLPDGAEAFTTVELKSNLVGTARSGMIDCAARLIHGGRTTQVWDAEVTSRDSGKVIALFRCTQMILYPR